MPTSERSPLLPSVATAAAAAERPRRPSYKASQGVVSPGGTTVSSVLALMASACGAGILVLPWSIAEVGLVPGIALLASVAVASLVSLHGISAGARAARAQDSAVDVSSTSEVALALGGRGLERSYQAALVLLLQAGALPTFIYMASDMAVPVLNEYLFPSLSKAALMLLSTAAVLPLCMSSSVHSLRHISTLLLAFLGYNVVVASFRFAVSVFFSADGPAATASFGPPPGGASLTSVAAVASTQSLAFCCQFNMLPVRSELAVQTEQNVEAVARYSIAGLLAFYAVFAGLGYEAYGAFTLDDVLSEFPASAVDVSIGRVLLGAALVLKLPLVTQPLVSTVDDAIRTWGGSGGDACNGLAPRWRHAAEVLCCLGLGAFLATASSSAHVLFVWSGAACGPAVCFVLPGALGVLAERAGVSKEGGGGGGGGGMKTAVYWCLIAYGIVVWGLCIAYVFAGAPEGSSSGAGARGGGAGAGR